MISLFIHYYWAFPALHRLKNYHNLNQQIKPLALRVRPFAAIFFAHRSKGYPLLSLTRHKNTQLSNAGNSFF